MASDAGLLILDDQETFSTNLGSSFRKMGFSVWLSSSFAEASLIVERFPIHLIVTELRIAGQWTGDVIKKLRQCGHRFSAVVVTSYPSVASAVACVRIGFDGYLAKPATATAILAAASIEASVEESSADDPLRWPTLDRTIWEYINQVFVSAGTMSEAARRLGLDRRSLRRMLSKYPPAR